MEPEAATAEQEAVAAVHERHRHDPETECGELGRTDAGWADAGQQRERTTDEHTAQRP